MTPTEYSVCFKDGRTPDGATEIKVPTHTFRAVLHAVLFHRAILVFVRHSGGLDAFKRSWDARFRLRRRGYNV